MPAATGQEARGDAGSRRARALRGLDALLRHRRAPLWIALLAFALRLPVLAEFLDENPFATVLRSDAALYWRLAGGLVDGEGFGGEPLRMAPLYPLLLAALRGLGSSVALAALVQTGLHAGTVAFVGLATGRLWGARAGTLAALLFAGLAEPALFAVRLQSVTLQLFTATGLWWATTEARRAGGGASLPGRAAHVGAWSGLFVLAFPAALLLWPLLLAGTLLPRRPGALRAAALLVATAVLVVAPATWHNWRTSGEWIPVTAHGGITLAHGNGPQSVGIYTPVEGVSTAIEQQHADAAALFAELHGRPGSWGEVDGFFRQRVLDWWRAEPAAALELLARKLAWFTVSRDYDNVVAFGLERAAGLQDAARVAPLAIPWLWGLAGIGAWHWTRERWRAGRAADALPELALLGLPVAVCAVFYFSARYRIVLAPVLCGLSAFALAGWIRHRRVPLSEAALGLGLPLALLGLAATTGFADTGFARPGFERALESARLESAVRAERAGEGALADRWLERARSGAPGSPRPALQAALFALGRGRPEQALAPARRALEQGAEPELALRVLYNALGASQRDREALSLLRRLAAEHPDDRSIRLALGWLLACSRDADVRDGAGALALLEPWLDAPVVDPEVALVGALARAERGDRAGGVRLARRGAARARQLGAPDAARQLEGLAGHLETGAAVRLPARSLALPAAPRPGGEAHPVS